MQKSHHMVSQIEERQEKQGKKSEVDSIRERLHLLLKLALFSFVSFLVDIYQMRQMTMPNKVLRHQNHGG